MAIASSGTPGGDLPAAITLVESTAPPTAHNRTCTIQWNRKSFKVAVPTEHCTLDEFMLHFYTKTRIEAIIAGAEEPWKSKLVQLQSLLVDFYRAQYHNNSDAWDLQLRNLVGTDPCVYWALFHNGRNKDGMTFRGRDRVIEQNNVQVAALLMTLEEMRARVPESIIDAIIALLLPGLHFHVNKTQHLKDLIVMQLCEGFLACLWGLGTSIILERLLQLPSAKVEATLAPIANFGQDALDFMQDIPNHSISALLTWQTLPSAMREMAKSSEFLQAHIHEEPAEGGFVTLNRLIHLFGDKLGSWQDAAPVCPRLVQLDRVVANLSTLLPGDIEDLETVEADSIGTRRHSRRRTTVATFVHPTRSWCREPVPSWRPSSPPFPTTRPSTWSGRTTKLSQKSVPIGWRPTLMQLPKFKFYPIAPSHCCAVRAVTASR